ncbi:HAD family hydrolase [Salininema proteolyticum]|uniref:HAD family hydrolase n=1 Tax=Salininema proteolyticum TaxID=1607685 RepID=UPI00362E9F70
MVRHSAAFFDLDKTIVAKSSALAFGRPLFREGLLERRDVVKAAYGQLVYRLGGTGPEHMDRTRDYLAELSRGWPAHRVRAVVTEALGDLIRPYVYAEAAALVEAHAAAGREVVLVSASGTDIVAPIAEMLGIREVIATRLSVDGDGLYTGEVEFYAAGEAKAGAIREFASERGIDLDASFAYSDSHRDEPMLRAVGRPRVVNGDRALRRTAAAEGWPVLSFRAPVPLGRRVGQGERSRLLGGLALASVGLWAWRRLRSAEASRASLLDSEFYRIIYDTKSVSIVVSEYNPW